ncbi:hypothetical protein WAI453_003213 [Rhynchosporium graminicola]
MTVFEGLPGEIYVSESLGAGSEVENWVIDKASSTSLSLRKVLSKYELPIMTHDPHHGTTTLLHTSKTSNKPYH